MSIPVVCPNGHRHKVHNALAGKMGLCPVCKAPIKVPFSDRSIMAILQPSESGLFRTGLGRADSDAEPVDESPEHELRGEVKPVPKIDAQRDGAAQFGADANSTSWRYGELIRVNGDKRIRLPKAVLLVGRLRSCDIVLRFPSISGCHAWLKAFACCWYVEDRDSKNGVRVNGTRVATHRLDPGDVVAFGDEKFAIEYAPEALEGLPAPEDAGGLPDRSLSKQSHPQASPKKVSVWEFNPRDGIFDPGDTKKCYLCRTRDQMGTGPSWMYCSKCAAKLGSTKEMVDKWLARTTDKKELRSDPDDSEKEADSW